MKQRAMLALVMGALVATILPGTAAAKKPHPDAPPVDIAAILRDPRGNALSDLLQDAKPGASTVVGHTTISNPSWTAVQTGAHSETSGVINNVFTPQVEHDWPNVYDRLETLGQRDRPSSRGGDPPKRRR